MSTLRAFTMPKWGIEMTEGAISEWVVNEGAAFCKGDIIAHIESDKISNEVEAEFDGKLVRVLASPGETHPVGTLLAVIATGPASQTDIDTFVNHHRQPAGASPARASAAQGADPAPVATSGGAGSATTGGRTVAKMPAPAANPAPAETTSEVSRQGRVLMSPAARAAIHEAGLDASKLKGSGRNGRITHQDVHYALRSADGSRIGGPPVSVAVDSSLDHVFASPAAKRMALELRVALDGMEGTGPRGRISKHDVVARAGKQRAAAGGRETVPMTPMRRAIARQVTRSKTTIPHFYLRMEVRVDALLALRARAKESCGTAPSVNDYLIRACACALGEVPDVNVEVNDDTITRIGDANVAVAVATDKGLFTVVVREAQRKSVAEISGEMKVFAAKAREGRLQASDLEGGSFTLSNLGMYGIDEFDAIISPPQGAILAVGAAKRRPLEKDFALTFATTLRLSLSCDHRAIDGATGARFMAALRELLEHPERLTA